MTYGDASDPLSDADLDAKFATALGSAGWAPQRSDALLSRLKAAPYDADLGWLQDELG